MRVAVHANHRAIEHYLYSLFPDMLFFRSGADGEMHLRDLPPNCIHVGGKKKVIENKPDFAIARSAGAVEWYRENGLPTIWFLSGPPQPGQKGGRREHFQMCQALVAYSDYHAELWLDPEAKPALPTIYVAHYPIDTKVFKGYEGNIEKALMIATMPMEWWRGTGWKGTDFFKQCIDDGMPYQLIGFNNDKDGDMWDAANPYPINDEAEMVECLAAHRVYGHTGTFLCRSPLEALAAGAPVVIRHNRMSHYLDILPHGQGVFRAISDAEFVAAIHFYLANPDAARADGEKGRERMMAFFAPGEVRKQWAAAFEGVLSA